jgi:uroporphyrinogen-III synthase
MIRILFTRRLDDTARLRLELARITCIEMDFLIQKPIEDGDFLHKIHTITAKHWVFTSQNAVTICFDLLQKYQMSLPADIQLYSLEGASKSLLEARNLSPTLTAESGSALAKAMLERGIQDPVCFVCGNLRMPYLPDILKQNGVAVEECVIYTTEMHPLSYEGDFDALTFFSPSGVDAFLIQNKIPIDIPIFAMGKTTAAYIQTKGFFTNLHYPTRPVLSDLIDLIIKNV